ncbi:PIN2/TERF1-interacting telomerase inhibitor 1 isoform X1 [Stomoxys calcitrans]|uniref:PIN2/TERF1-interacting telomerase inhibitor 1 isoform X1 n=1 Tax=Stomoxys calcitrans TaxID=35570 RepID=UPI0027E396DF|nr:PIN2/TERF1-interacting telomerase inhibitor 1 isoform X1 [Stomoxys calcitrans]
MAMLAEPRQRKRYNLVPRGKALYEDESRFGTKMLERMGWSKGKGLGAKEDGAKDFVRVRYKNDSEGLGFEHRDDQWTQHENSFNGLLKSLNGEEDEQMQTSEHDDDVPRVGFGFQCSSTEGLSKAKKSKLKEKISGISLEERSKKSKARVHYKKFTKGKDLSQYSEKDLANIFGKKAVDETENQTCDLFQQLSAEIGKTEEAASNSKTGQEDEKFGGVQTIATGLSVTEYFNMKMAMIKKKSGLPKLQKESKGEKDLAESSEDDKHSKLKNKQTDTEVFKSNKFVDVHNITGNGLERTPNSDNQPCAPPERDTIVTTKKKPKKQLNGSTVANEEPQLKQKKSKKKKYEDRDHNEDRQIETIEDETPSSSKKTKKSKKKKDETVSMYGNIEATDVAVTSKGVTEKKPTEIKNPDKGNATKEFATEDTAENICFDENVKVETLPFKDEKRGKAQKRSRRGFLKEDATDSTIDSIRQLSLQDLKDKINSFNICEISTFTAEKFRNVDLNFFPNSTLSHVDGYRYNQQEIQLRVEIARNDEDRINKLWSNTLCKYTNLEIPKKTYRNYAKKVVKARITKQPKPKLNVKTWSRKSAFLNL